MTKTFQLATVFVSFLHFVPEIKHKAIDTPKFWISHRFGMKYLFFMLIAFLQ